MGILPLFVVGHIFEASKRPFSVQHRRKASQDVRRDFDAIDPSSLVFPVLVHQGVAFEHRIHVFQLAITCVEVRIEHQQDVIQDLPNNNEPTILGKGVFGTPPRHNVSLYKSLAPSRGAIQVRDGGCSAAMYHCAIASQELPTKAVFPVHQSRAAMCSMAS